MWRGSSLFISDTKAWACFLMILQFCISDFALLTIVATEGAKGATDHGGDADMFKNCEI